MGYLLDEFPGIWLVPILALVSGLAIFGIVMKDSSYREDVHRELEVRKLEWFADCEAHEPRYRCEYLWEQM